MTKEQIDQMVNAFLRWKLPQTFNPDCYISFNPKPDYRGNPPTWPVGTNLFSYTEAKAMVEHMVAALTPPTRAEDAAVLDDYRDWVYANAGLVLPDAEAEHKARAAVLARMAGKVPTWQPIESAPKDGSWIIIANAKWDKYPKAKRDVIYEDVGVFYGWVFEDDQICFGVDSGTLGWNEDVADGDMPTHWMPLPAAPEAPR